MITVVIPTLNAAAHLPATLAALAEGRACGLVAAVIVADGGSDDGTAAIARSAGATVIAAPRGRGQQLAAGAKAAMTGGAMAEGTTAEDVVAKSDRWLFFLHADSRPGDGWVAALQAHIANPANTERAAAFRFALDDNAPAARRLERVVAWRSRALGLAYGDQGLLIAQSFYRALGGFPPLSLMEDVDLIRRIGRRRLSLLDVAMTTSAVRYRNGYWRRSGRNLACLVLYYAGMPTAQIARLYGGGRQKP